MRTGPRTSTWPEPSTWSVGSGSLTSVSWTSRISSSGPAEGAVLEDDGAPADDEGRQRLAEVDRAEDAVDVELAVALADDADLRAGQLDLADEHLAVEDVLLVVVDDGGGGVEEVAAVEAVVACQAEFADQDAAQQAEAGVLDVDADVRKRWVSCSWTRPRTAAELVPSA